MTTHKKADLASVDTSTALVNVRDYYPALTATQKAALTEWNRYEKFLTLPFVPKSDAAEQEVIFDILRLADREGDENFSDQWVLLVRIRGEYVLEGRNSKRVLTLSNNQEALIGLPKGEGLRDKTAQVLAGIIAQHGEVVGMKLVQLDSNDPMKNGPIILRQALDLPAVETIEHGALSA